LNSGPGETRKRLLFLLQEQSSLSNLIQKQIIPKVIWFAAVIGRDYCLKLTSQKWLSSSLHTLVWSVLQIEWKKNLGGHDLCLREHGLEELKLYYAGCMIGQHPLRPVYFQGWFCKNIYILDCLNILILKK
jgi:hypothetical protein